MLAFRLIDCTKNWTLDLYIGNTAHHEIAFAELSDDYGGEDGVSHVDGARYNWNRRPNR